MEELNREWVGWHLQQALEELQRTAQEIGEDEQYCEAELRIALAHAYHHLNTAWNSRGAGDARIAEGLPTDFEAWQRMPTNLLPQP